MDVGSPFLVKGKSKKVGILLSHGYMAAPREVKGLAYFLGKMGYWVYVPRLKGHGTSPDDLALRSYQDWMRSIDRGYAIISSICRKVVVGGFSTGAGPLASIMLFEFHRSRPYIYGWRHAYEKAVLAGELTLEESVRNYLTKIDTPVSL